MEPNLFGIRKLRPGASKETIEPLLGLSNQIFDTASAPPTRFSSLEEWLSRLSQPSSILVFSTKLTAPLAVTPLSSRETTTPSPVPMTLPTGFVFAHIKSDPNIPCPTLHIWLAGVSEQARGTGLFAAMMREVETHARSERIDTLSVATFPEKFAKMFSILQKQGWEIRDWREEGKKVLLTKRV